MTCKEDGVKESNHPCLHQQYNKLDLPFPDTVNLIHIGIDTTYVLRINDKVVIFA